MPFAPAHQNTATENDGCDQKKNSEEFPVPVELLPRERRVDNPENGQSQNKREGQATEDTGWAQPCLRLRCHDALHLKPNSEASSYRQVRSHLISMLNPRHQLPAP
jgi:hypothetical protein